MPATSDRLFYVDADTGEVFVGIRIEGLLYAQSGTGDGLIVQAERGGRLRWAVLDDDGDPIEPWYQAPPGGLEAAAQLT
jgi:hypothetical protein